jgi:hypothetical protein
MNRLRSTHYSKGYKQDPALHRSFERSLASAALGLVLMKMKTYTAAMLKRLYASAFLKGE